MRIPKNYLSPSMLRMLEMLERIDRLSPTPTTLQKINAIHTLGLKKSLSVSAFRYQQKGISGMFKKANFTERMLGMFSQGLHEKIEKLISELETGKIYIEEFNERFLDSLTVRGLAKVGQSKHKISILHKS